MPEQYIHHNQKKKKKKSSQQIPQGLEKSSQKESEDFRPSKGIHSVETQQNKDGTTEKAVQQTVQHSQ